MPGDILEQSLPFYCFQGHALAHGHIPAFNPYAMAGYPFAGDPQSGWMYLPAMLLFTALPCAAAIRWFLVLQPILAGLGVYWFLRAERAGRAAATAAGLVLALLLAGSVIGLEIPFAGALAWTSLTLAAAARYLRADRWSSRLLWLLLTAIAWGQIAAAHLSDGLVVGTLALALYALARLGSDLFAGRRTGRQAAALVALALLALAAVNMAFFLPRIAYLPETTLALGYTKLYALSGQLIGLSYRATAYRGPLITNGGWILGLAWSPGAYLGAAACALSFAGPWSRRHRAVALAFLAYAALCWVLAQHGVAALIYRHVHGLPLSDFYVHAPDRFRDGALVALPVAAGLGLDAFVRATSNRVRLAMLLPGIAFWWILPAALGLTYAFPAIFLVALAAAAVALAAAAWRPALAWLVTGVLLVELTASAILGARPTSATPSNALGWGGVRTPTLNAAAYLRRGTIAATIADSGGGRFVTLSPKGLNQVGRAYLLDDSSRWAAVGDMRSLLFDIPDAGGYNPVQPLRYWEFVRKADGGGIHYNSAFLTTPVAPFALDLLQVRWIVAAAGHPPEGVPVQEVVQEGSWVLYELQHVAPRASVITGWSLMATSGALDAVAAPGFDPSRTAVLEATPVLPDGSPLPSSIPGAEAAGGTAEYADDGPQSATIQVDAPTASIVLIRNVYDPRWHATVDGRPAPVVPADYLDEAVTVPAGRHTIVLEFRDPSIGRGLVGSAAVTGALAIAALAMRRRERTVPAGEPEVSGPEDPMEEAPEVKRVKVGGAAKPRGPNGNGEDTPDADAPGVGAGT